MTAPTFGYLQDCGGLDVWVRPGLPGEGLPVHLPGVARPGLGGFECRAVVVTRRVRAYGIASGDRSEEQALAEVLTIREVARCAPLDLRAVSVMGSSALLARFVTSVIDVVLVASVLHLSGWLDAVRRDCEVWALSAPGYWPRIHASGLPGEFIAGSGLCR